MGESVLSIKDKLQERLQGKLSNVTFEKNVARENIVDAVPDLRVSRPKTSIEVFESFKSINLLPVSPLLTMKVGDNGERQIIDGQTRKIGFPDAQSFSALVIPEMDEELQIFLNYILNSKRSNLSDYERLKACEALFERFGWEAKEIAETLKFSLKDVERHIDLISFPDEVKDMLRCEEISQRKIEEAMGDLYKNNPHVDVSIKDAVAKTMANKVHTENLGRDSMHAKHTHETLDTNLGVMHNDYTPEQIVESSYLDGEQSNFICEHPSKVDAVEQLFNERSPKKYIGLCAEGPILYDAEGNKVTQMLLRASTKIGKDNVFGVGYFEGAKIDDVIAYDLPHYRGNMFKWLDTAIPDPDVEFIFIDSFGGMDFWSKPLLELLAEKYPNAEIVILVQSRFHNRRGDIDKLEEDCIKFWGLEVPDTLEAFISKATTKLGRSMEIFWTEENESGQPVSLVRIN